MLSPTIIVYQVFELTSLIWSKGRTKERFDSNSPAIVFCVTFRSISVAEEVSKMIRGSLVHLFSERISG